MAVETTDNEAEIATAMASVTVPTLVELVDNNSTSTTGHEGLKSAAEARIRLTAQEARLFQVIVETAEAFARGQISLPKDPDEKGDCDDNNKNVRSAASQEMNHHGNASSTHGPVTTTDAVAEIDSQPHPPPHQRCRRKRPTLRVAGGWVRDKLLGLTTHDVDMAVDSLTGVQFAQLVHEYAAATNQHDEITQGHRIGIIACNPEQSKHLETAALQVCGLDVDLANLRAQETYHEDSRIPTVRLGTPLEDAERRDFTINALFYNLHTQSVEDWTQRSMNDLFHGKLVTPLEPIQTFFDDPLRVLRAIRFAVRFQFALDPKVESACRRSEIHQALRRKVSRERVGKELEGMLSGTCARQVEALLTIARLQLSNSVFTLPLLGVDNVTATEGHILGEVYNDNTATTTKDNNESEHSTTSVPQKPGWTEAQKLLRLLPAVVESHDKAVLAWKEKEQDQTQNIKGNSTPSLVVSSTVDRRLLPVAVFLLPFRTLRYQEKNKTDRSYPVAQYIFQYSIKFKQSDTKVMSLLQDQVDHMVSLLRTAAAATVTTNGPEIQSNADSSQVVHISRLEAGLLLRACKETWVSCLLLATVLLVREESGQSTSDDDGGGSVTDWMAMSNAVWAQIVALGLDECWKMKPLLDGKALIAALKIPKGPQVGQFLEEEMRWMLQYPSGTKQECEAHLKAFRDKSQ
ncbi:hypothetical protein ACA910_017048 [Epithemia clementina (nom. ined.)]